MTKQERFRWSEIPKDTPLIVILDSFKTAKLYIDNKFILMNATIDYGTYQRQFELSVPFNKLKRAIIRLPMDTQALFEFKTKLILYKRRFGNVEIKNIQKYVGDEK